MTVFLCIVLPHPSFLPLFSLGSSMFIYSSDLILKHRRNVIALNINVNPLNLKVKQSIKSTQDSLLISNSSCSFNYKPWILFKTCHFRVGSRHSHQPINADDLLHNIQTPISNDCILLVHNLI